MSADFQPGAPAALLAVMAHPDDAELWAGGTLTLHARNASVTIAVVRHDPQRMAEAQAGAAVIGARLHVLAGPASQQAVRDLIVQLRPEVIITHPLGDVHPDHRSVAAAVLAALPEAVIATGQPRRVYTTDTYNSLTLDGPVRASVIIDITATFEVKMKALAAHASTQPIAEHFGPMAETIGRLWGARIGARYAEAFTSVPVLGRLPAADSL
ncbi:MAG: PIG-L deacetylase family protein [Streptosporangiaceae bacterium]